MLYLIMYFSIFALGSFLILCFTSVNSFEEEEEDINKIKEFNRFVRKFLMIFTILIIISVLALQTVKSTYYLEPIRVSENEIVSIETNNTKVFYKYIDENGASKIKETKLKNIDLTEYNKKEKGWKIVEYVVYTKTDMNPTLFKILTFNHLPKEQNCYKIEK